LSISPRNDSEEKWVLTRDALDKLLEHFSPDREEAARQFEVMRTKLIRYFEWQSSPSPEDETDITMNRVARKIEEGQTIFNLPGYFRSVAYLVFLEAIRRNRTSQTLEDVPEIPDEAPIVDEQKEARLLCLDECLDKQSFENRKLILEYYVDTRRAKINHRRQLAKESTMNTLRIRACRIRKRLEKCVRDCIERQPDSK
jgi:DNA-directed RNA polymerase specialized sigma24 family protein